MLERNPLGQGSATRTSLSNLVRICVG